MAEQCIGTSRRRVGPNCTRKSAHAYGLRRNGPGSSSGASTDGATHDRPREKNGLDSTTSEFFTLTYGTERTTPHRQ